MKQLLQNIRHFSKMQWIVVGLVAIAVVTRFYNLADTVQFLGDQGRDALVVSRIFTAADPIFIGPVTSVGNMYLGPLYYYFMLPFLWLSYPSPMGPVYAVAALGVLTVFLMYWLGKEMVGEKVAVVAAALYTFSTTATLLTRFSWNPNPAPLVSLILLWAIYRALKKTPWYWVVVTLCFAVLIQLHYITLLSGASFGIIWMYQLVQLIKNPSKQNRVELSSMLKATVASAIVLAISTIPLMLFDWKHNWLNVKAFVNLFLGEDNFKVATSESNRVVRAIKESHGRAMHILFETTLGKIRDLNEALLVVVSAGVAYLIFHAKKRKHAVGEALILVFLFVGIAGTALYEHSVYDHYIAYLFPMTFFLLAILLVEVARIRVVGVVAASLFFAYYVYVNMSRLPLGDTGWKISDIERTSAAIAERVSPGEKYNVVLLSETGDIDAQNYRYYLSTMDTPPVLTEDRGSVETLFIINEDRALERVIDSPIYEIVVFPNKDVDEVFQIPGGPEITVLRKSE